MNPIWIEKYRPANLSEIFGQDDNVSRLKAFVKSRELPHLIFSGPAGTGKTSAAMAVAIELFGESWKENFLELNASNNRGINVIRGHEDREKSDRQVSVKDYARIMPNNPLGFKIIFMDEADQLTPDAQAALRRTMEIYSSTTRFIFSVNYSSQIIPPIQSRCVVMRFRLVAPDDMKKKLRYIAEKEKLTVDDEVLDVIAEESEGDLRKALNIFQSAHFAGKITPKTIYEISGMVSGNEFRKVLSMALQNGLFNETVDEVENLMVSKGVSGMDVVRGMHSALRRASIDPLVKIKALIALGEAEFRLVEGSSDKIQIDALLARMAEIHASTQGQKE
ncbi:MAG: replication factor C small subunit [Thermoplasmataceae archaeon]